MYWLPTTKTPINRNQLKTPDQLRSLSQPIPPNKLVNPERAGFRYLLRSGFLITSSIALPTQLVQPYIQKDGSTAYALVSSAAEQHLMDLIKTAGLALPKRIRA